jgi:hypothetical protein
MKQFQSTILFVFAGTFAAFAQPVFTGSTYFTNAKNFDLNFQYSDVTEVTTIPVPAAGNNKTYDYSNVTYLSAPYTVTIPRNSVPTLITDATHQDVGLSDNISSTTALAAFNLMYKFDPTGVSQLGWAIGAQGYSLGGSDSINIPTQYAQFSKPIYTQKFPMTIGTLINDNKLTVLNYNFTLSFAAAGLKNAPGVRRLYITQKDSIVGWGVFIRKSPTGTLLTDSVLVSSRVRTTVDSFFLNGAPAPDALVGGLGATQGRTVSASRYSVYLKNRAIATMVFIYSNANFSGTPFVTIEFGDALHTPTNDLTIADNRWSTYPNPVYYGRINLTYTSEKEINFSLVDALGQPVQRAILPANTSGAPVPVSLTTSLPTGLYFANLQGEKNWETHAIFIK